MCVKRFCEQHHKSALPLRRPRRLSRIDTALRTFSKEEVNGLLVDVLVTISVLLALPYYKHKWRFSRTSAGFLADIAIRSKR